MPTPSPSRRHSREAAITASKPGITAANRAIAANLSLAHAILELAYQIGRLADLTPVYGPPEEDTEQ